MPSNRYTKGRLAASLEEIFRADRESVVTAIVVCNTSSSNRTFEIQHVPADESASDDHCLFHDSIIRANVTTIIDTPVFLSPGDAIFAGASAAAAVAFSIYVLDYASYLNARGA